MDEAKTIKSPQGSALKNEIIKRTNGDALKCFNCGTCTASCPVMRINSKYNPRRIVRMLILGLDLPDEGVIWMCSTCHTCHERCPQGVNLPEVMNVLKNIAVEKGRIHPSFKKQIELLEKQGRLYEIGDFDNKKRVKAGLPEIHAHNKNIKKIFKSTGVDKLVESLETKNEQ